MRGLILPPIETINLPIESNLVCEIPFAKLSFNIKGLLLIRYKYNRNIPMDYRDKLTQKSKRYKRRNLVAKHNLYPSKSVTPRVKYSRKFKHPNAIP